MGWERIDVELIIQPKLRVWRLRLRASGKGREGCDESPSPKGNVVVRSGGESGFREGESVEGRGRDPKSILYRSNSTRSRSN